MAFAPPNTLTTNAAAAIDVVLTQEAGRIGSDIHKATLHTSPWIDLIKQTTFPEGMGYQLNTLVYDRALPLTPVNKDLSETGTAVGVSWSALGTTEASGSNGFSGGQQDQTNGMGSGKANVNVIDFTKTLKNYSLSRAVIESPRINVEDLRFAAHRTEQLRAIMDLLKESVRNSWEERYRDEYAKLCDNVVICKASGTAPATGKEGSDTPTSAGDVDADNNDSAELIAANISNKVLDDLYFKLVRAGAGNNAYGRENGRPVFSLVCSSEASYQIMTESESIKDDIRYNNSRVSELIAPLGVEKSFRGFYHLVDDLAPRYSGTVDGSDKLVRVQPYIHNTTTDKIEVNPDYDSAPIEEAFLLVDNVMESLIPAPITGANGLTFDPVNYKGDFKWTNILDQTLNPDGTIGFFRGIMASASKPIKTNFGYSILFNRTSSTLAA
tara:strand:- start:3037 stop:4356 length:1320 start_codon:yes stop_codon:yes gene_type:complete